MSPSLTITNRSLQLTELQATCEQKVNLKDLILVNTTLQGTQEEMIQFHRFFRGHPTIENITWSNVTAAENSQQVDCDLLLATALVSMPHLKSVSVVDCHLSSSTIECVSCARKLTTLHIIDQQLGDEDASRLASSVSRSKTLQEVELESAALSNTGSSCFDALVGKGECRGCQKRPVITVLRDVSHANAA